MCCGLIFLLYGCLEDQRVIIRGELPVSEIVTVEIRDYVSGRLVLSDTLGKGAFALDLGRLPAAIYSLVFSWERDVLTPRELQKFARYESNGLPRFFVEATCWLDPAEAGTYTIGWSLPYSQIEIEHNLLFADPKSYFQVRSKGKNNRLYEDYLALIEDYRNKNQLEKARLKKDFYRYNDTQDLEKAKELGKQYNVEWIPKIYEELLSQEIVFMQDHAQELMTAFIFCSQINTKQDFEQYRAAYNLFPESTKTLVNSRLAKVVRN